MHPTAARYLVESRQSDLRAEAARERLVSEARRASRGKRSRETSTGFLATTRQLLASIAAAA
jgi:hypothetical protein